ncbi:MAG: hypothetical protein GTO13_10270 [Proteobacteria bacterium]|nr:hypothetical protein [Pseudomonadota bacterium]
MGKSKGIFTVLVMLVIQYIGPGIADTKDINWQAIATKEIMLFYPAQSHWQWLNSQAHEGSAEVRTGEACLNCHEGQEKEMGKELVKGGPLEPTPIEGKPGHKVLKVQAAYDNENIYMRYQWDSKEPGKFHDFWRYDGEKWEEYGGHRVSAAVTKKGQPPNYEDRLALLIDDGNTEGFSKFGCFITCHDSMRHMPALPTKKEVKQHPYLGKKKNRNDIRKYIPQSRQEGGGWADVKPEDEVKALQAKGVFLDLWQWRAHRSNPVGYADDDWVLEYRWSDKGKLFKKMKLKDGHPPVMFDKSKTGYYAFQWDDRNKVKYYYLTTENSVPYDPQKYKPKKGDIIPQRLIEAEPSGSRADVKADGEWKDGKWTVILTRKLNTGDRATDKAFKRGKKYTVGLAVHDDHVTTRFHHVSLPQVMGFDDPQADINVMKIK